MNKAKRQQDVLEFVSGRTMIAADIAKGLGIHHRTINRDLAELINAQHIAIDDTCRPPRYSIVVSEPEEKNPVQAFMYYTALRSLTMRSVTAERSYINALQNATSNLPSFLQDAARKDIANLNQDDAKAILEPLIKGWFSKRQVAIEYVKMGETNRQTRDICIYHIEISRYNRKVYVVAYDINRKEVRTFRFERIYKVTENTQTYDIPAGWQTKQFFRNAFGVLGGSAIKVHLKFDKRLYNAVMLEGPLPKQEMEQYLLQNTKPTNHSFEICIPVAIDNSGLPTEFLPYIRGWGAQVEVLGPENVRQRWLEDARGIVAMGNTNN